MERPQKKKVGSSEGSRREQGPKFDPRWKDHLLLSISFSSSLLLPLPYLSHFPYTSCVIIYYIFYIFIITTQIIMQNTRICYYTTTRCVLFCAVLEYIQHYSKSATKQIPLPKGGMSLHGYHYIAMYILLNFGRILLVLVQILYNSFLLCL